MLVGCGDDDDDDSDQPAAAQAQQQQQEQPAPAAQQQTQQEQQAEQAAQQAEQQERQQQGAEQQAVQQQQQAQSVQAAPSVHRGGIVRYGAEYDLIGQSGMDPSTSLTQSGLWRAIYDPLIATRADGIVDLDASLAEAFEAVDDTTIVFTLREGVKFHDGTEFDAEAARFNLDRAVDTSIPAGGVYAAAFSVIESKEVLDTTTLKITLGSPNAALLTNLQERGGMMASPTHVEATTLENLRAQPVGTGPYQLQSWENEQSTVLVPFQDSWQRREDGGPYALLDEFQYVVIPDAVVRAAAIESGDVDTFIAPDSQVGLLLDNDELNSVVRNGSLHLSLWVNHDLYPMSNVDFRRALMHAWDKEGAKEVFYEGRADVGTAILSNGNWAHAPQEGFPTEFNMDKAEELLVQSGIPEEDWEIPITASWAGAEPMFQAVAGSWEQLGVRIIPATYEELQTRPFANRGQAADLHFVGQGGDRGEPDTFLQLALTEKGTWNLGGGPVPEVEGLVQDAVSTYDTEERRRIYAEIQEIQADLLYCIMPGLYTPRYYFSRNDVGGAQFDLNGFEWFKELHRIA
jgi:ABC-type transport system substrate-binding protein